jgi:hypothetical protein
VFLLGCFKLPPVRGKISLSTPMRLNQEKEISEEVRDYKLIITLILHFVQMQALGDAVRYERWCSPSSYMIVFAN